MNFQAIFWTILAVIMLVGVPITLVWTLVDHLRGKGSERTGSGGFTAGISASMQELDRLVSRPSIEHQIETEHQVHKREDDADGE